MRPFGFDCCDFSGGRIEANNLRIDLALADAARDDLRVLRAEIEDENFRVRWFIGHFQRATDESAGRYALRPDRPQIAPTGQASLDR